MSFEIAYRFDHATADEIAMHLSACEVAFVPALSTRVDIAVYAEKIARRAVRSEAWNGENLVGLVAGYCNDLATGVGFITSVSVLPDWTRRGIGRQLVRRFGSLAQHAGMRQLSLEVNGANMSAMRLYERIGFVERQRDGDAILMKLDLGKDQHDQRT